MAHPIERHIKLNIIDNCEANYYHFSMSNAGIWRHKTIGACEIVLQSKSECIILLHRVTASRKKSWLETVKTIFIAVLLLAVNLVFEPVLLSLTFFFGFCFDLSLSLLFPRTLSLCMCVCFFYILLQCYIVPIFHF